MANLTVIEVMNLLYTSQDHVKMRKISVSFPSKHHMPHDTNYRSEMTLDSSVPDWRVHLSLAMIWLKNVEGIVVE